VGCVLPTDLGQVLARQAARHAGLPDAARATTISKVCVSGVKATKLGHGLIKAGSGLFFQPIAARRRI
jgi:acetyl-CoA C-acetyltransferase